MVTWWNGMQMVKVQADPLFRAAEHCSSIFVNKLVKRQSAVANHR